MRILDCWRDLKPLLADTDELGGFQFLELRNSLPDEVLMYADKLSMAHSLEVRVPFLDLDVVRYAERLSESFKIRLRTTRYLHRRVCRRFLPESILKRKKQGFAVNVVDDWFRQSIRGGLIDLLCDPGSLLFEYLRYEKVEDLIDEHARGRRDNHKILFSLVLLEKWLRRFIKS